MRFSILHELPGRLRIHMHQSFMSIEEADILEAFLLRLPDILEAKVSERTANVLVLYRKDVPGARQTVLSLLAGFSYDTADVEETDHRGRTLQHEYMDRMAHKVLWYGFKRLFFPAPVRNVISAVRAVPYVIRGLKCLLKGQLKVDVLDAASILVSLIRGDFNTAGEVMLLLEVGDLMEEWTYRKSVNDLAQTMALNVDRVFVKTEEGREVLMGVNDVSLEDKIVVRMGNMIPLDGEVVSGEAMVNQSSFTGEPLAVRKKAGSMVYAGCILEEGELLVRVTRTNGSGRYDRIISMIEESEALKSEAEIRASHTADRLVPWTFLATGLTYLFTRNATRAASILMVDFCCALKLSMPIAVLSAMREAGEEHISVKGGRFLEAAAESDVIVFDKTGTLTEAQPSFRDIITFNGTDADEMLRLAACLEEHFPHPVANAVVKAARDSGLDHEEKHSKVEYVVAHGIASSIDGERVCIGSYHFLFEDEGCVCPEEELARLKSLPDDCSHLYMAIGNVLSAVVLIEDPMKKDAKEVLSMLRESGIRKLIMMTGDSERTAARIASDVGVDEYYAEVLPEDKASYVKKLKEDGSRVIMVGDGINDSPALSAADVGIAMNSGAAIAREIADITISEDDLKELVMFRNISTALMARISRNYRLIVGFNSLLIALGIFGLITPSVSALLHNSSTILISLGSMRDLTDHPKRG